MKKIREIIRLTAEGEMSQRQIARALRISRPVVAQYLSDFSASGSTYEQTRDMADSELLALFERRKVERSSKYKALVKLFPHYAKELKRTGVTRHILWEEYIRRYQDGYSYSQFCYHFQIWISASEVTMHIDHKAGDKMFVDYAGVKLTITDRKSGKEKPVEVFVAILGASQYTYAEASPSQKSEDWLRSNERALWYYGGVPMAIVPDNLRSGISWSNRYEPGINALFDDFAKHYRTVILPTRVASPQDKALVENAVKLVYQRIYAPLRNRTFYSLEELNEAIRDLLEQHNDTAFQRLKITRRELFDEVEKQALKSLPAERYPLKKFLNLKVQFNYHVELREDRHYYSVPWQLKGERVRVIYDDRNVAIYYDNVRTVQYQRDRTPGGYTTMPHHMPAHHRQYSQWSSDRFIRWAESIGKETEQMIKKVLGSRDHPEQAFKVCMGILHLAKTCGPTRLNKACRRALSFGMYSYKRIKNILDQGLEEESQHELEMTEPQIPSHKNIRGSHYYK